MCTFTAPDCYFCWRICMHNFLPDITPQRAAFVIWHYWWQQYLNQVSAGTDSKLALVDALGFGPSSSNPSAVPCSQNGLQIFVWELPESRGRAIPEMCSSCTRWLPADDRTRGMAGITSLTPQPAATQPSTTWLFSPRVTPKASPCLSYHPKADSCCHAAVPCE